MQHIVLKLQLYPPFNLCIFFDRNAYRKMINCECKYQAHSVESYIPLSKTPSDEGIVRTFCLTLFDAACEERRKTAHIIAEQKTFYTISQKVRKDYHRLFAHTEIFKIISLDDVTEAMEQLLSYRDIENGLREQQLPQLR